MQIEQEFYFINRATAKQRQRKQQIRIYKYELLYKYIY